MPSVSAELPLLVLDCLRRKIRQSSLNEGHFRQDGTKTMYDLCRSSKRFLVKQRGLNAAIAT